MCISLEDLYIVMGTSPCVSLSLSLSHPSHLSLSASIYPSLNLWLSSPHVFQGFPVWCDPVSFSILDVCRLLQCIVVYCSVVQCGAVWCFVLSSSILSVLYSTLQFVTACCRVLQCVEMWCSVVFHISFLHSFSVLPCIEVYSSVLQCVAV